MKRVIVTSTFALRCVLCSLGLLAGCHAEATSSDSTPPPAAPAAAAPTTRPIPPDSIFAKINDGMGEGEVTATIGAPTSIDVYQTGKAWNPFNFSGSDNLRKCYHYKGVGTITFSLNSKYGSSYSISSIDYDPNEPGFAK